MSDHRVLSLLGRWHQWRRGYSTERGYARPTYPTGGPDEDELEHLTMLTVDDLMETMPADLKLALQHVARAECMGVEVVMNPRLGNDTQRANLIEVALSGISRKLLRAGVL